MQCQKCNHLYDGYSECPQCVRIEAKRVFDEALARSTQGPRCKMPRCLNEEMQEQLCVAHWSDFCRSIEFSRVRTAISDWARRMASEAV